VQSLTDGTLLDAIRGLHWPARRATRAAAHGSHRSRRIGSSPEFVQYREYRPGDDASKIDWKLYGRTERVNIRQTRDDSELRTSILVDASASMAYPLPAMDKWRMASAIALGLAAVALSDRDPVGLAVVGGAGVEVLPPRSATNTVANIQRVLESVVPGGSRPLAPVLSMLRTSRRVAIISDFLGDADALLERAGELVAAGREVFAVHIVAREELEPRALGHIVVDPEEQTTRRPLDEAGLEEYRSTFARWREELASSWRAKGIAYQLAVTDEPADQVIRRVVTPAATAAAVTRDPS
jgi:uncharacterized protein (DUF58 family)